MPFSVASCPKDWPVSLTWSSTCVGPGVTQTHAQSGLETVLYFSTEFGLGEGLSLYAGGLGIWASPAWAWACSIGKATSGKNSTPAAGDLSLQRSHQPAHQAGAGFLRRLASCAPRAARSHPAAPGVARPGEPRHPVLLDSNDPFNSPSERGITTKPYVGGMGLKLMQEIVLSIGGRHALEAMGLKVDLCHFNEGHAA